MRIVQITAVTEHYMKDGEFVPYEDATVYGLGEDNKLYYWGEVESEKDPHDEIDAILNKGNASKATPEKQLGWIPSGK